MQGLFDLMDGVVQVLAGFVGFLAVVLVQLRQGMFDEMLGVLELRVGGLLRFVYVLVRRCSGLGRGLSGGGRVLMLRVKQMNRLGDGVIRMGAVLVVIVVGVIEQMFCLVQLRENVRMR